MRESLKKIRGKIIAEQAEQTARVISAETELEMKLAEIKEARLKLEEVYKDSKQPADLNDVQSRDNHDSEELQHAEKSQETEEAQDTEESQKSNEQQDDK